MTFDHTIFRVQDPFVFTIFGASGDLAKLKIFPAIFALAEQKRFPKEFAIVGYARSQKTQEGFRDVFTDSVKTHYKGEWTDYQETVLTDLIANVHYFSGQYDQIDFFQDYQAFLSDLFDLDQVSHITYFSVPPFVVEGITQCLAEVFEPEKSDLRLILEKPFGEDESSAKKLFGRINQLYREDQLYLLDHYLGKKAVRSLIPLRHMNRILNAMIKGTEIANIQISAIEPMGVGDRIGFFDEVGTTKDVVQSHLLQILAMLTMSIPVDPDAERIQEERAAILAGLEFSGEANHVCLGQYAGYKNEDERTKNSDTDTFSALRINMNRESWHDVPIFLRTGKCLQAKKTYLVVELKKFAYQDENQEPNRLIIEFFPHETIQIRLLDEDGSTLRHGEIAASESIACHGDYCLPEHGLLFLDVIRGDNRFFLSMPEIIASWRLVDQVMNFINEQSIKPEVYEVGSGGPIGQDNLMKGTNFTWYDL